MKKLCVLRSQLAICLATNEGEHTDGIKLDANSMSAVVLIEHNGNKICLLAADSGRHSLDIMLGENRDLRAQILVFPHHGGHTGGPADNRSFAKDLVSAVQPKLVLFSLGRGSHGTPRPEIVAGTQEAISAQQPYIACTQLSKNCADALPSQTDRKLLKHSEGFSKNHCCAGTITIPLSDDGIKLAMMELSEHHGKFVTSEIPKALCRRQIARVTPQLIMQSVN